MSMFCDDASPKIFFGNFVAAGIERAFVDITFYTILQNVAKMP